MTLRVLVVDDQQQFRREMREGLYRLNFARSGETALHMLDGCASEEIIRLLLDIDMSGMSGLDLLSKIKRRKPVLPVFVISAYGDANTVSAARKRGADQRLNQAGGFRKTEARHHGGEDRRETEG